MKRFLIFLMVVASCLAIAAQNSVTIDHVTYSYVGSTAANGAKVVSVDDGCDAIISVQSQVTIDGNKCYVVSVSQSNNSGEGLGNSRIEKIIFQSAPEGERNLNINYKAFANSPNLTSVELPSDLKRINPCMFMFNDKLTEVIYNRTALPSIFGIPTLPQETMEEYKSYLSNVTLYVPDEAIELFSTIEENSTDSEWPSKNFWSAFNIKPLSKRINPAGIKMNVGNGAIVTFRDMMPGDKIELPDEIGFTLYDAKLGDIDLTPHIQNNILTIPEYSGTPQLQLLYEQLQSLIQSKNIDKLVVRVMNRSVSVMLDNVPVDVDIYNMSGQKVYGGPGSGISLDSGVYLLKAENRTFKFAL